MPYTESDYPKRIKKLPAHARRIWISAYNSAYESYDAEKSKAESREAYANSVAWAAVKKKYKKDAEGKWVAKALTFNVAVVKTVIKDGQRRFMFTGSSDRIDLEGERLDPSIFDDFVHNFEKGYPGPIHVDIAHWSYYYPGLKSQVYTGEVDQLYRDGRYIKGWAFEYPDNPLSEASWEMLRRSAKGELDYPISCSLGFMPDFGNIGYEDDVFTYRGGRNKAYIDHLAKTAFPAHPDAEIILEEVAMATKSKGPTPTDDARKVLGNDELVAELEEARKKTSIPKATTDEGLVIKAKDEEEDDDLEEEELDEEALEEEEEAGEEEEIEERLETETEVKAATEAELKAQKKRAKASGIAAKDDGNVTMPKKWREENVPDSNASWGDWTNYRYPLHKLENVRNASSRIAQDKNREGYSAAEISKIEGRIDKAKKKFKVGEYSEKAVTKAELVEVMPMAYGGATTIQEVLDYITAADAEAKAWNEWYMFKSVAENILNDPGVEDKAAAMSQAIDDFKDLLTTKSLLVVPSEKSEAEVKAETEVPSADEIQEAAPAEEAPTPEVKAKTEPEPSPEERGVRVAKSWAEAAEAILTSKAPMQAKRAAMGESLVEAAQAIEAVLQPPPTEPQAQPVDVQIIVKTIEAGFEKVMATMAEQAARTIPQEVGERPPRPQRKSVVPPIEASAIVTKKQNFGEIVDRLLGG